MSTGTQIIPMRFGTEINECDEFRRLAERTDARRLCRDDRQAKQEAARERRSRAYEERERRACRNFKLMGMGAAAAGCGAATLLAMQTGLRVLAVFPVVLMAAILLVGACEK